MLSNVAAAVVYLTCSAAIVGWSLPDAGTGRNSAKFAMATPAPVVRSAPDADSPQAQVMAKARSKLNCAECGVIESMRRIDAREEIVGWCALGETAGTSIPRDVLAGGQRFDPAPLADIAAGAVAGDRGAMKIRVTTQHQIVVRFRDGSKHVFNEETPRTVRVGDRIQVIAGAVRPNG